MSAYTLTTLRGITTTYNSTWQWCGQL